MSEIKSKIKIVNLEPRFADALAQLQYDCFPTIDESEYYRREHFLSHFRIFPEGSFVALDGERVIGFASGIFTDFDLANTTHTSREMTGDGYYTTHDPQGDYYYAVDIGTHPDYRGRGVGSLFYEARKRLVRKYNKKGIIAGGILPGYVEHRETLSVPEYVEKVVAGELFDSTLSFQLKNGFKVMGLLQNYVEDAATGNWGTLIFWENPDYR